MFALDLFARLLGAFYTLGGAFALRAAVTDFVVGGALSAVALTPPAPGETARLRFAAASGFLTLMGGLSLALLSFWAAPLFVANLALQVAWLAWARRALPPEDPAALAGRRSTTNAAWVWAAATTLVLGLALLGRLGHLDDLLAAAVLGLTGLAAIAWGLPRLAWRPEGVSPPRARRAPEDRTGPARVRLEHAGTVSPLWDADTETPMEPADWLAADDVERLAAWAAATPGSAAHRQEGEALAQRLEAVFGEGAVFGPVYGRER